MAGDKTFSMKHALDRESGVVIVGASAAGLYAAYLLAQKGVKVRVFDAQEELGPPARTLIVTPYLDEILGATPPDIVVNRTGTLRLYSPGCLSTVRLGRADLIVERERLVRWLSEQATSAGAEIYRGRRFVGLEPDHGSAVLTLEDAEGRRENVQARIVIGADGGASVLAQQVGCNTHAQIFLSQAIVPLPSWADVAVTQIWFDPERTRYFFWLIPESRKRAAVGLIADNEAQAQTSLKSFLLEHGLSALEYQEAWVPCYSWKARIAGTAAGARVYLVGDAAAQVKMTTVGGVVTGLWGARAAARSILRGTSYAREALSLQRELKVHLLLRQVLNRLTGEDYDDLLTLLNRGASGPLGYITRDEAARLLWKVGLAEPRFALITFKALLGRQMAYRRRIDVRPRKSEVG